MEHRPEQMLRELETRWQSLTIANDFVFGKVMLDEDLCREVLETILNVQIDRIEYIGREDSLNETPEGKGVRLDVYVRDGAGTIYNVEMQATDTHELPQRTRYYHSMLTFSQLSRGDSYRSLRDAYVIFICGFDLFGKGHRVYSFENRCLDDGSLALNDGTHTIFLAASSPEEPSKGKRVNELLDYVAKGKVSGELSSKLNDAVSRVRNNDKWRLEFMWQEVRDQLNVDKGREKGLIEGREQGLAEGLEQGIAEGREQGIAEGREKGLAEGREKGLAEGREKGLAEGREQGIAEGRERGLAEGRQSGEARLANLVACLAADGRTDDIARAASDPALRQSLYEEYGIKA